MASCARAARLGNGEPRAAQFVVLSRQLGQFEALLAQFSYCFLIMQCFTSYENNVPFQNLPYNFKNRLANLSSVKDVQNLRKTCPEFNKLCSHRPKWFDQVYITDNETVYKWASRRRIVFQIFKWIYIIFRFGTDNTYSFRPTWQSVLHFDDVLNNNKPIFVTDTLVLHCQSIEAYEKLIPYICGPFTRLTIHGGSIRLHQLERLMGKNVNLVEITANLDIEPDEYDDFVELVKQHINGWRDK
uniref:F-box domain-containing protein n=1 Tax=Panagrellus redivivus TaxID=6233 RepID=A0A7E4V5Y0_PANRE